MNCRCSGCDQNNKVKIEYVYAEIKESKIET
jgi:hypothetical protein